MSRGIKIFIWYVLGLPVILLSGLIEGEIPLGDLADVSFWTIMVILYHMIWAFILYFGILNRRCFIPLSPWITSELSPRFLVAVVSFALFLAAWALSLVFILISLLPSAWVFVAWVLILLVAIYFWFYRGICVYENGKLRVFQGRITTVKDGWLEEMSIEKHQDHDILRLRINGRVFSFRLPPDAALNASDRIREELDDIADYGFADET
ncbi:MAG: hypothetical protein J6B24_13145 [Clostridia bacterium]|nr:hypothetical protein [Clostridia bacterium]